MEGLHMDITKLSHIYYYKYIKSKKKKKKKTSFGLIILCIDLDTIHTIP